MDSKTQWKNERRLASGHSVLILITLYRSLVVLYHFVKYLPIYIVELQIIMQVRQTGKEDKIKKNNKRTLGI